MPERLQEESRMECQVKTGSAGEKQARQGLETKTDLCPSMEKYSSWFYLVLSPGHVLPKEGLCGI